MLDIVALSNVWLNCDGVRHLTQGHAPDRVHLLQILGLISRCVLGICSDLRVLRELLLLGLLLLSKAYDDLVDDLVCGPGDGVGVDLRS